MNCHNFTDILTDELRQFKLDTYNIRTKLGHSKLETHIAGIGSMTLGDIKFVYTGRKDREQRRGVRDQ